MLGKAGDGVSNIQNILWLFDGWMTKDEKDTTINSPGMVEGLKFIHKMYHEDKVPAIDWDNVGNNEAYQTGQAAFICNPAAVYSYLSVKDPALMEKTGLLDLPSGACRFVQHGRLGLRCFC